MQRDADWNDWRAFLAVARSGSTLAASRVLRVSQTTVARRVAALEEALGLALFERRSGGYALTAGGKDLIGRATAIEEAALAAEAHGRAIQRGIEGTVRITSVEIYSNALLAPHLLALRDRYPDVRIEIDNSSELLDLGTGAADIALRSSNRVDGTGLFGRFIAYDDWTLYCSLAYAEKHGVPTSIEALQNHVLIGGGGGQIAREYGAWIAEGGLVDRVSLEQGSASGLLSAVRTGLGVAALPCLVADGMADLVRCAPPPPHDREMWLMTHERVRHQPAVRAVIDFLYDRISAYVRGLENKRAA